MDFTELVCINYDGFELEAEVDFSCHISDHVPATRFEPPEYAEICDFELEDEEKTFKLFQEAAPISLDYNKTIILIYNELENNQTLQESLFDEKKRREDDDLADYILSNKEI